LTKIIKSLVWKSGRLYIKYFGGKALKKGFIVVLLFTLTVSFGMAETMNGVSEGSAILPLDRW